MHGNLLPNKKLYSLDLISAQAQHALSAQHAPNLETLQHCLGHVNYQTLRDMVNNGMIEGTPKTFHQETLSLNVCPGETDQDTCSKVTQGEAGA